MNAEELRRGMKQATRTRLTTAQRKEMGMRYVGFTLWIGGTLVMWPLWMRTNPLALVAFFVALIGGGIVGWTEANKEDSNGTGQ